MAKYKPLTREERKEKDAEYIQSVASLFIEGIKENKVPWMRPWKSNEYMADHNPVTKTIYSGINEVYLGVLRELVLKSTDPRWYTFNECKELGYNVRKGSKGSVVSFFEQLPCDKDGKVIPAEQKNATEIKFYRPYSKKWVVFNGSQIDVARKDEKGNTILDNEGKPVYDPLSPYVPPEKDKADEFIPIEKAEKLIDNSGAVIKHDSKNSYYRPSTDEIHLLPKDQYLSPELYYDTALHELSHWTGHKERLNRPMMDKYGTIDYAREELNAEIAGYMMCKKLNLDFSPQNNIAYVQSWVKKLSDVPSDIFDSCATASKISTYCLAFTDKMRQTQKDTSITIIDKKTGEKQNFEWSNKKEAETISERGIMFTTAALVFFDENKISKLDIKHSDDEDRFQILGFTGKVLLVVATEQDLDSSKTIRIISARKANLKEIKKYNTQNSIANGIRPPPRGRTL